MKNEMKKVKKSIKERLIPIKNISLKKEKFILKKPNWLKIKVPVHLNRIQYIKSILRKRNLHSICEEAACPNLMECFHQGTASFMILGSICTRRCPFCKVKNGRPIMPDSSESEKLANTILEMKLNYVVITSVNRDDLHDGGAKHFIDCMNAIRNRNSNIKIEILVPDFRRCENLALKTISTNPPDVFNHNMENVPRLYSIIRPGSNYQRSLRLLKNFKDLNPNIPTKSGLMMGLGETDDEILSVMKDLRLHGVTMLTIGQYLQPSSNHLPVARYVSMKKFHFMKVKALEMGFTHAYCGPFVRSSYHAALQAQGMD